MSDRYENTMSVSQVARLLNVTTRRVDHLVAAGRLSFIETPLGRLYPSEAVHRLAAERAEQAKTDPRVRVPGQAGRA